MDPSGSPDYQRGPAVATHSHEDPTVSQGSSFGNQPNAGVITQHGRPGVYIYPFWQRTEFWVMALTSLAVAIAAAIEDGFPAQDAWTLITALAVAYILSRGFAKREPRDDDSDRTWTPSNSGGGRFGDGPGR
jgi:hypothetical protein